MEIKNILADLKGLDDNGLEKTASQNQPVKVSSARDKLISALDEAMTPQAEKTASVGSQSATGELVKLAANLANSESEALTKEAHVWGAAVADGFMTRLGEYEQATRGMEPTTKVASASGTPSEEEFEKFAQENPDLVKQAMELGYLHGKQQIDELKKLAFEQGYTDASAEIEQLSKTAEGRVKLAAISQELNKQASAPNELAEAFEKLAETPAGQEKLAAIRQGYTDGMAEIEKTANDCFERGYNDTIEVLRALDV
jgi:hypothetical protein